ncbi:nucleoid-associated protein [Kaistella haifensis DSM 19056]|uniref:Nucleoid-associated protein n=1 Tax=Kaistella haifensis DSM 19056 TaxID=1450526 RepID=A0A246B6R4_9FLAO|nr:nucleoid-associated protein [Kaistella haifensis]OWK97078.1 nucleoid-associated protein [Kaistella haifensis DSM 19056]
MKIIAHKIGNKINQEGCYISSEELQLNDNMLELLQNYFLGAFKTGETFHFYSDSYLSNNRAYKIANLIFEDPETLINNSQNLGRLLYDAAENPRVQGGELFIVFFPKTDENDFDKIGIFKTEKRESFLKIHSIPDSLNLEEDKGISLTKIDKAALIYNTESENGYVLQVVDNNKNGDLYYWFEDFLKVKQRPDDFFQTQQTMSVFKDFVTKQLPQEYEISMVDQSEFLNKSLAFFKEKEEFSFDEFTSEVLEDEQVIESFGNYLTDYEQEMQISILDEFPISVPAVKKQQRSFKSIIKLDKNFHIYVHGDRKLIENGEDENGKYYKLYFEQES